MDSQHQQHAHLANAAAWQVPPPPHGAHAAYMVAAAQQPPHAQYPPEAYSAHYAQQQQHPAMLDMTQHPHALGHVPHHPAAPPGLPAHHQPYASGAPHEPSRGSVGRRTPPPSYRGSYRERSYSPPPRHRRTPSPRGYRDSRGYDRDAGYHSSRYDRGYDRGYDRSDRGYDRGYSSRGGYDRDYDRGGYDRGYDRGYGGYRGYDRGYGGRARSPQRKSRTVNLGTEADRLASKTLYVGNIPYSFLEPEVEDMFKKFGTIVKVTVVMDQYTGRNKGFAFVEYEDRKCAEEALEKYNGFTVEGRRLKLDWDIGLGKKDIKPRSTATTTENSTAEASPQPQTQAPSEGEATAAVEGEVQSSTDDAAETLTENQDRSVQGDNSTETDQPVEQSSGAQDAVVSSTETEDATHHQEQEQEQEQQLLDGAAPAEQ